MKFKKRHYKTNIFQKVTITNDGSSTIIDQLKKNQILELLKEGKRIDGRALDEVRELTIDVGVIPKAEGSARAKTW